MADFTHSRFLVCAMYLHLLNFKRSSVKKMFSMLLTSDVPVVTLPLPVLDFMSTYCHREDNPSVILRIIFPP